MKQKIGFIGGGNMAASLIGGLVQGGTATASQVMVYEPNKTRALQLADQFGVSITGGNEQLVAHSDIVVIAVKPQVLKGVLSALQGSFKRSTPLIVSIVAGISIAAIEQWLGQPHSIVRIMPNTPALIGQGASGLFANDYVSDEQRALALCLANAVGYSAWVDSEQDIDSVTALSGSGPAYFMLFIQALIDSAVNAGLEPETAKLLAVKTASGAAALIESSELPLQTLINNVTSPGGTTEQALRSFDQSKLTTTVEKAFKAAKLRSAQLGDELS